MAVKYSLIYIFLFVNLKIGLTQKGTDSIEYVSFLQNIESLNQYYNQRQSYYLKLLKEVNIQFCLLNREHPKEGDQLLKLLFDNSFFHKEILHQFLIKKHVFLNEEQIEYVKIRLSSSNGLRETDKYFHELVSMYKLEIFSAFLKKHISPQTIKDVKKELAVKKEVSKKTLFQLTNMATLSNLGAHQYEDSLTLLVNEIYNQAKKEDNSNILFVLFHSIIPHSITKLNSKSSVINTMYLLDENDSKYFTDDIAMESYAFSFFLQVIQPKLKDFEIENLAWTNFEENKEEIKRRILNDNTIWWDHIKMEE